MNNLNANVVRFIKLFRWHTPGFIFLVGVCKENVKSEIWEAAKTFYVVRESL